MLKRRLYLSLIVPLFILAGCGSPSTGGTPQLQVSIGATSLNIEAGKQGSFAVTLTPRSRATGTILVSQNIELASTGITVGPLTPWSISGSSAHTRQFNVSTGPDVVPGKYVITLIFSLDGREVGRAAITLTVRSEGSAGPLQGSQLALGFGHGLVIASDGSVWAWGSNENKQLVTGVIAESARPLKVPLAGPANYIAAGDRFSYAVLEDGTVWAWGDNGSGEHGSTEGTGSSGKPAQVRLVREE